MRVSGEEENPLTRGSENPSNARDDRLNGHTLRGRYLKLSPANAPKHAEKQAGAAQRARPEGCRTVFVRNLPYDASVEAIKAAFGRTS